MLADVAEKALRHMTEVVRGLLGHHLDAKKADTVAEQLSGGHYTHDDPITVDEAKELGLPVEVGLPDEAYELMELFPQAGRRRPSVQYVRSPLRPERSPAQAARPVARAIPNRKYPLPGVSIKAAPGNLWNMAKAPQAPILLVLHEQALRPRPPDGEPARASGPQGALPLRIALIDAEDQPDWIERLGISVIPTLVLVKDRRPVDRLEGRASAPRSSG